jgi:diguanylate cyclase (GGDEF)-like protein
MNSTCKPDREGGVPDFADPRSSESRRLEILQMIARMEPLKNTLRALVMVAGELVSGGKAALLLVKGQKLSVAAASGLSELAQDCLASLAVPGLACDPFRLPETNVDLVFRTVLSGAGEVLGGLVFGPAAAISQNPEIESHLATLEGLATLAIEQSHLVEELNYRLEHDSLTGLYDRLSIERRMSEALAVSARSGPGVALIVLAIDRFRRVNAALGCRVGNGLLRQTAQRLERNMGSSTNVGRAGGDEFLVLVPHLSSTNEAIVMAERLLASVRMPYLIEDHELSVTAAAGISISSQEDYRPEDLEARAYAALDYAKSLGGNQSALFDCSMVTVSPEYLELETKLRGALEGRELLLYYQPQVSLETFSLVGVEALLRWQHPDLGLVSPSAFIPMAEQGGLIGEIGEWALKEGIRQLAIWKKWGVGPLRLGVNVSPHQFRRRDFARRILDIFDHSGLDAGELLLEITEGAVMQDLDHAVAQINRLRDAGIRFAIDDFGTGYSALSYLQKIPADEIKVDRTFVQEILSAGHRPPLLANILRLASELGISTIAEGIETREQADALAAMGCRQGQGFLFSRPLPGIEMVSWFHPSRPYPGSREMAKK